MTNKQLTTIIDNQIEKLPFGKAIDFAVDICKRLLPDYVIFHQNNEWGNPELITEAITFCENNRISFKIDENELTSHIDKLESVTPDTEDFGDWDGSYALNAACATLELLEYLRDRNTAHIKNISSLITDTIDFKINEETEEISDEQLKEHPKIIKELAYQIELIK